MHTYIPDEKDCITITPGLKTAPADSDFDASKLKKDPRGAIPTEHLAIPCDGYHLGYFSTAGSKLKLGGVDTGLFSLVGIILFAVIIVGLKEGNNAFPWLNNEYGGVMWFFWSLGILFLFLGLWVRQLAKKDGFSYIIFSREYGTVTFPKVATDESLTVPFKDVELSAFRTIHTMGTHQWHTIIRTNTCRPGQRPRKEGISMHGMNKEDFQKEWNMIARFMDKQQSIPPCLHLIISNNQKTGEDIWYKPMPKERIFNPPLCPPGAP